MDNSNEEVPNSVTQFQQERLMGVGSNITQTDSSGSGLKNSGATRTYVSNAEMINVAGVEMPIASAYEMGLIENPNQTGGKIVERQEAIDEARGYTPGIEEDIEEVPVVLSEDSQALFDEAVRNNHSATHNALGELLKDGDISEGTLDDLRQATGKSTEEVKSLANEAIGGISTVLEFTTQEPSAGELLMDCYNESPNMAQMACQNALSGDLSLATDLVIKQKQDLDHNPRYREGLKEALERSGYFVEESESGRFVISGNDLEYHTSWKHMAKNFHLNFADT